MIYVLFAIRTGTALPVDLSGWVGVLPRFANCFCKLATVAVNMALLLVRVALLLTSAAKIFFSMVSALANELK